MVEHFENSDGLGAIFPPMIYTVVALKCLGYDPDSPAVQWAWRQLDDLRIDEGDRTRVQPCVSPVWDTAIATIALSDADQPEDEPAIARAEGVRSLAPVEREHPDRAVADRERDHDDRARVQLAQDRRVLLVGRRGLEQCGAHLGHELRHARLEHTQHRMRGGAR